VQQAISRQGYVPSPEASINGFSVQKRHIARFVLLKDFEAKNYVASIASNTWVPNRYLPQTLADESCRAGSLHLSAVGGFGATASIV
jgi:hypothetical protein